MAAGEDDDSDRSIDVDRISKLPESLIHHILDLMRSTKDVVRTQLLSKKWKRVFDSYQTFDFDQIWFRKPEKFKEYVEKSLATRLDRLECVDKFRLCAGKFSDTKCMAGWIRAAIAKNVKELNVDLFYISDGEFPMDLTHSSSLTSLKIRGSLLQTLAAMKMCNLREISIVDIRRFDSNLMKKLEENCPLMEDLRLCHCLLSHLHISSLNKLKTVLVQNCYWLEHIKIEAPNLETFNSLNLRARNCRFDLRGSNNLRNLSFKNDYMDDSAFEGLVSVLPLLENLKLHYISGLIKAKISSLTLRSLNLVQCQHLKQVEVDAPNLHSFQYKGHAMHFPSVNAPRLSRANFSFDTFYRGSNKDFFWSLVDGSNGSKLLFYTKESMKIFEAPREDDEPYQANDDVCEVELTKSPSRAVKIFEEWLSENKGRSLVLVSSPNSELLKSINALIVRREESRPRRYLKVVNVSDSGDMTTSYILRCRRR